jgi:hypothetical protein
MFENKYKKNRNVYLTRTVLYKRILWYSAHHNGFDKHLLPVQLNFCEAVLQVPHCAQIIVLNIWRIKKHFEQILYALLISVFPALFIMCEHFYSEPFWPYTYNLLWTFCILGHIQEGPKTVTRFNIHNIFLNNLLVYLRFNFENVHR